ncbi:MAG: HAD hydrolase-like protein [Holosporales bacterium]|jgi:HAD superfamily hydrolase (TIGR01450 family)|nr:HAD hydrolase-like protein [Holosporales bacterium]
MIFQNVEELYEKYDSFFIDVYGVIYNGRDIFDGAHALLEKMKSAGKKIIILSNSTLISSECKHEYEKKGIFRGIHYDEFITSGEAFRLCFKDYIKDAKSFFPIFHRNDRLFSSLDLNESDSIETADFVYVGTLYSPEKSYTVDDLKSKSGFPIAMEDIIWTDYHDIAKFEPIAKVLDECLKYKKPLVIVNPDIFAIETVISNNNITERPILCQGGIGELYEKAGGEVLYFGKPCKAIYDFAKKSVANRGKTVMIGDTLWTDILGGNSAEIDTILVLTGVSGQFLEKMGNEDINKKIEKLITEVSPKMTYKRLSTYSQTPTHIAYSFA